MFFIIHEPGCHAVINRSFCSGKVSGEVNFHFQKSDPHAHASFLDIKISRVRACRDSLRRVRGQQARTLEMVSFFYLLFPFSALSQGKKPAESRAHFKKKYEP